MKNVLAMFRIAVPVAACAAAVVALAISPTWAEQDWIPIVATTNVDATELTDQSGVDAGWDPLVLLGPKQFAPITTQSISPPVSREPVRRMPLRQPRLAQQQVAPPPQNAVAPEMLRKPEITRVPTPVPVAASAPVSVVAPKDAPGATPTAGQQYCINIADTAADARFAWQKKTLGEIEQELDRRIALLEQRAKEYREWLARRDEFAKKAQGTLVEIYTKMRPDAAALQLAAMDEETAAAVLTKLKPRNASAILSEMPPGSAARLTTTIAGAAKVNPDPVSDTPAVGGKS